jgi:nitrite reductase/ring-hydroxylating ferredoxin subunit
VCVGVFHGVCPFQSGRCCRVATRAEWQFARAHGARCASRTGGRTRPPSVRRALTTAPVGPVEALPPRG